MASPLLAIRKASQSRVQPEEQVAAAEAASSTSHSVDQKLPTPPKTSAVPDHNAEAGPRKKKSGNSKKSRSRRNSVLSDSDEPAKRDFAVTEAADSKGTGPPTSHNLASPDEEFPNPVLPQSYLDRIDRSLSERRRSRRHRSRRDSALLDSDSDVPPDLSLTLDGSGQITPTAANNMFPSFLDTNSSNSSNSGSNTSMQRSSPLAPQQQQNQVNGTGSGMNGIGGGMSSGMGGLPMNAGQQMDVNMLYQKVVELSEVLRDNRERTQGIVAGAEELAVSKLFPDSGNVPNHHQRADVQ